MCEIYHCSLQVGELQVLQIEPYLFYKSINGINMATDLNRILFSFNDITHIIETEWDVYQRDSPSSQIYEEKPDCSYARLNTARGWL